MEFFLAISLALSTCAVVLVFSSRSDLRKSRESAAACWALAARARAAAEEAHAELEKAKKDAALHPGFTLPDLRGFKGTLLFNPFTSNGGVRPDTEVQPPEV